MPSSDLKTSIEKLGASFTGVLPTGFTKLWGLDPFSGSGVFAYGDVTGADQNARVFMKVDPLGTFPGTQNAQVMVARGICHLVVENLPDVALPELLESLKTMFEFYSTPPRPVALPQPRRTLPARVTGRQERRPLSFAEDE